MDLIMKLAALGDSIIKGVLFTKEENGHGHYSLSDHNIVDQVAAGLHLEVVNLGKMGCTIESGENILDHHLSNIHDAKYALLCYGGNDSDYNWREIAMSPSAEHHPKTPLAVFEETYARIITKVRQAGLTPVVLSLPEMDAERYQTIFAKHIGAVAAPAAGMHFSKNLLKRLEIRGVETYTLTSHMGLGNFKSVDVEDLSKHKVESEQISISEELVHAVDKAHEAGHRVCAVGTEVMRALEHVVGTNGQIKAYEGWTNKFIYPPYDFTVANAFFVNFYMPQSSQLMMVAAFGGHDQVMRAYKEAVKEGYRFGDYGDAMLILND